MALEGVGGGFAVEGPEPDGPVSAARDDAVARRVEGDAPDLALMALEDGARDPVLGLGFPGGGCGLGRYVMLGPRAAAVLGRE